MVIRSELQSRKGEILPEDMMFLDLQMIVTLGLQKTVNTVLEREVKRLLTSNGIALDSINPKKK
ncbi:hypothetical protein [Halalkalibacter urbisdiaboli]|uniref:hypothetical protein n=1 Tax=Halalkalibacter urbisdiaboli TaxID=1960589 RepID=UPI0010567D19|nr:hypothetical protein [Halalkalibacter urbisdiaboli]